MSWKPFVRIGFIKFCAQQTAPLLVLTVLVVDAATVPQEQPLKKAAQLLNNMAKLRPYGRTFYAEGRVSDKPLWISISIVQAQVMRERMLSQKDGIQSASSRFSQPLFTTPLLAACFSFQCTLLHQ